MKKLLLIGPAPQNTGGVSIHIRRLVSLLQDDFIFDFVDEGHQRFDGVFNLRSGYLLTYLRKIRSADVVHIQSGVYLLRLAHILVCKILFNKKTIVTIHHDPTVEPFMKLTKRILRLCDDVILVNRKGYDILSCEGSCCYHLIPAFLPPVIDDETELPHEIKSFIAHARSNENGVILCSYAPDLILHNGVDLYGLDLCIEAMTRLDSNYFLIFIVVLNTRQSDLMECYMKQITANDLDDRILIWKMSSSFVRLIEQSDIFLRTTNTDGDSISVREALYLNRPVIASDVIERPAGTLLFENRNVSDLVDKIKSLTHSPAGSLDLQEVDYKTIYMNLYNS